MTSRVYALRATARIENAIVRLRMSTRSTIEVLCSKRMRCRQQSFSDLNLRGLPQHCTLYCKQNLCEELVCKFAEALLASGISLTGGCRAGETERSLHSSKCQIPITALHASERTSDGHAIHGGDGANTLHGAAFSHGMRWRSRVQATDRAQPSSQRLLQIFCYSSSKVRGFWQLHLLVHCMCACPQVVLGASVQVRQSVCH